MLELLAVPHSWIPQVETGFSMALYSVILLCVFKLQRLPMSQQNLFSSDFSCLDLSTMESQLTTNLQHVRTSDSTGNLYSLLVIYIFSQKFIVRSCRHLEMQRSIVDGLPGRYRVCVVNVIICYYINILQYHGRGAWGVSRGL